MRFLFSPTWRDRLGWLFILVLAGGGAILGVEAILTSDQASILIEWTTASEMDVVGYNVLRGETTEGPFEQINSQLIPSSEDPLVGGEYSFLDREVQPGKTYIYLLEDVESSGEKNRHGPITQKAESNTLPKLSMAGLFMLSAGVFAWIQARGATKKQRDNGTRQQNDGQARSG
jgi:hypothetical protein